MLSSAASFSATSASAVRAETIQTLRRQLVSSQKSPSVQKCIPTGLSSLDQLLPGGGLPTSALIEWISDDAGQATASMALRAIRPMLALPGCLSVIDERHDFYADAARAQGIPLSRILLIRPRRTVELATTAKRRFVRRTSVSENEALWALEQSARCPGVRTILCWLDRATSAIMRRLQLAIERSGVTIMLIRSASALAQASFADLRLHVKPRKCSTENTSRPQVCSRTERSFQVRLLRSRHGLQHDGHAVLFQEPWHEQICCRSEQLKV